MYELNLLTKIGHIYVLIQIKFSTYGGESINFCPSIFLQDIKRYSQMQVSDVNAPTSLAAPPAA